jgi:hypothetical protein
VIHNIFSGVPCKPPHAASLADAIGFTVQNAPYDASSRPTEFLLRPTEFFLRPTGFLLRTIRRAVAWFTAAAIKQKQENLSNDNEKRRFQDSPHEEMGAGTNV